MQGADCCSPVVNWLRRISFACISDRLQPCLVELDAGALQEVQVSGKALSLLDSWASLSQELQRQEESSPKL